MSVEPNGPSTLLYVAGFARSGSTLLGNLLGQIGGFSHVGELGRLWLRITRRERTHCGCGRELSECPVWSGIIGELDSSDDFPPFEDMWRWYEAATAHPRGPDWSRIDRDAYVSALGRLYSLVFEKTGAEVLVDSSKQPGYGAVLDGIPGLDVTCVHLVRDPRGVMASRLRKSRDGLPAETMRPLLVDPIRWRQVNRASQRLALETSGLTTRYEDLTASPGRELERIAALTGVAPDLGFLDGDGEIILEPTHTVWGNKSRFDVGELQISQDLRWRDELSRFEEAAIRISTRALMRQYGYG